MIIKFTLGKPELVKYGQKKEMPPSIPFNRKK